MSTKKAPPAATDITQIWQDLMGMHDDGLGDSELGEEDDEGDDDEAGALTLADDDEDEGLLAGHEHDHEALDGREHGNEAPDEDLTPWTPQAGSADDPYQDREEERTRALAPLMDRGGKNLTWSSLRFLRASGDEKLDLILNLPDPARAVQAMAPEEFVLLVKDIGLSDAGDLLSLASPRQLQATLDLDAWLPHDEEGMGQLDTAAVAEWLLTAQDAGPEVLQRFVGAQDDGLLSLMLSRSLKVILPEDDLDGDIITDDAEVFASPDGTYRLVADPDDPHLAAIRVLLNGVYRQSVARGRALLLACRWEMPAQLEEDVLSLRNGRLEDMGFLSRDEALALHSFRDPVAWKALLHDKYRGTAQSAPDTLGPYMPEAGAVRLGLALRKTRDGTFLADVMALLPEAEMQRLRLALVRLGYRVQSARAQRPSDIEELAQWSRHALCTASMALEFLADRDVAYASLLLRETSLSELFTAGYSLTALEQQKARRLRTSLGGDAALSRLSEEDAGFVRGLASGYPLYVRDGKSAPVETLDELQDVHAKMAAIAAVVRLGTLVSGGDVKSSAPLPIRTLVGTAIAWQVATGQPKLDSLDRPTFQLFLQRAFSGPAGQRVIKAELRRAVAMSLLTQPDVTDDEATSLTRYVDAALDRLADELGGLDPQSAVDLRYVGDGVRVVASVD